MTQSRAHIMYNIYAVWIGGAGGVGDGSPMVSRVSFYGLSMKGVE